MLTYIKTIYYSFVFLGDNAYNKKIYWHEKLSVFFKLMLQFGPVAYVLGVLNLWFSNNKDFVAGFIVVVFINAILGWIKHNQAGTFDFEQFWKKTGKMILFVSCVYVVLSILNSFAGENFVTTGFRYFIQVTTLFYPASKAIKSIFYLSGGEYPSKFIMDKFYNFEKDGDIHKFLNQKSDDSMSYEQPIIEEQEIKTEENENK